MGALIPGPDAAGAEWRGRGQAPPGATDAADPFRMRRFARPLDWALELMLQRDIVEISVRRTRTRPGEAPGEVPGEPVSMGARPEATDELTM